ncbi:MAG: MBL fold metallo-hydrolase [Lachnoclostridium edouardi]|uniref:MBL fold metallo-hydrolase n=1 Tax=Lachnoclostridium edouardi TaxID=1926283 RepID=UPI0026DCE95B|nr:MBL fold metallo-hydrolase [Lachnoclostridium edouardi]MDO4277838.1 MBL fold metallo-hydrolase [Lachnoclostridium edouardi]
MIKITALMDDCCRNGSNLMCSHGLSFHIDYHGKVILFDFGQNGDFISNAGALNLSIAADAAVCSHNHYDHAGGYPAFLNQGGVCPLITGENFFCERYSLKGPKTPAFSGGALKEQDLNRQGVDWKVCRDVLEVEPGCFAVGNFPRVWGMETVPKRFIKIKGKEQIQDEFEDEICLVIDLEEGLTVITGCSHPGILNMASKVHQIFKKPVYRIIGGTHLKEADQMRIMETGRELVRIGVKKMWLGHCTGRLCAKALQQSSGIICTYYQCGDSLEL